MISFKKKTAKVTAKRAPILEELKRPSLVLQIVNRSLAWLIVLIVLITLVTGYTVFLSQKIDSVRNAGSEFLPRKEDTLSALTEIKKELDRLTKRYSDIETAKQEELDRLLKILPTTNQYLDLFAMVEDITKRQGFTLHAVSLGFDSAVVDSTKPRGRAGEKTSGEKVGLPSDIKTTTISISVSGGGYQSFKNFLDILERNIRLLDISSVSLDGSALVAAEDPENDTPVNYTLELRTYHRE